MADRLVRLLLSGCLVVAIVATAGSLYFSEVMGLVPCELCWYQRILMYPLVVILGIGLYEADRTVWKTGLPFSLLGTLVSAYHASLQLTPDTACAIGSGCATILWQGLGIFTIPRLALVAFVLLSAGFGTVAAIDRR